MYFHTALLLVASIVHVVSVKAQDPQPPSSTAAQPLHTSPKLPKATTVQATRDENDDECLSSAIELAENAPTPTNTDLNPAIESFLSSAGQAQRLGVFPQPTIYCEALVAMPNELRYDYMSWESQLQEWCTEYTESVSALATKCPVTSMDPFSGSGSGSGYGDGLDDGEIGAGSDSWKGEGAGMGIKRNMARDEPSSAPGLPLTAINCEDMSLYVGGGCTGIEQAYTVSAAAEHTPDPVAIAAVVAGIAGLAAAW